MQATTSRMVPVVTTDGTGVVSHAGTVLLAEPADRIGLTALLSEATDGLAAVTAVLPALWTQGVIPCSVDWTSAQRGELRSRGVVQYEQWLVRSPTGG